MSRPQLDLSPCPSPRQFEKKLKIVKGWFRSQLSHKWRQSLISNKRTGFWGIPSRKKSTLKGKKVSLSVFVWESWRNVKTLEMEFWVYREFWLEGNKLSRNQSKLSSVCGIAFVGYADFETLAKPISTILILTDFKIALKTFMHSFFKSLWKCGSLHISFKIFRYLLIYFVAGNIENNNYTSTVQINNWYRKIY